MTEMVPHTQGRATRLRVTDYHALEVPLARRCVHRRTLDEKYGPRAEDESTTCGPRARQTADDKRRT